MAMGELESAIMDILWRSTGSMRVREVLDTLNTTRDATRELAYTTVMTVLDNLHRKDLVTREMADRAWHYQPATSREELAARSLRALIDSSGDPEAVLLHFADTITDAESSVLRRALERKPR